MQVGSVGAGTGATVGKWRGREHAPARRARRRDRRATATSSSSALVAVNACGDIDDGSEPTGRRRHPTVAVRSAAFENTTIGVIATNAALDKVGLPRSSPRAATTAWPGR